MTLRAKRASGGAALLAAMLTVALVAAFAASALWQQWRATEIESAERSRVQAAWILTGALDWARLILREDARNGGADHLAEPWAVPLQEARLSSFLAADKSTSASDTAASQLDVFLSGQIDDMQARLNVLNLVDAGKISAPDMLAFTRLYDLLGLPQAELRRLAENLRFASDLSPDNRSGAQAPLLPQRLEQLAWLGVSAASLARLAPHICLLPARTPVNLNTARAEVLYASIPGLDRAQAQKMVDERTRSHFRTLAEAGQLIGEIAGQLTEGRHSVATRFFEVRGRLRMDDTLIEERSLVQRDGLDVKALRRERAALGPPAPAGKAGAAGQSLQ